MFTISWIHQLLKKKFCEFLKSNKASGYDDIVNEHIRSTIDIFLPIYCKLFNIVLNSGLIPESWSEGVFFSIYKNKGDTNDPRSYRHITLVSCLSKTCISVLNDRLCELSDEVGLISESQTGFRKGYSTLDNIFSLQAFGDHSCFDGRYVIIH